MIDPSNSSFSYILTSAHLDLKLCFALDPVKIYKANGSTGPKLDEWRDCVDIAVKIGFGLERNKDVIEVDSQGIVQKSLVETITVKNITNQCSVYDALPKIVHTYPIRAHQSSDRIESALTTLYLKLADTAIEGIYEALRESMIDPFHLKGRVEQKYDLKLILSQSTPHADSINALKGLCNQLNILQIKIHTSPLFIEEQECAIIGGLGIDPLL